MRTSSARRGSRSVGSGATRSGGSGAPRPRARTASSSLIDGVTRRHRVFQVLIANSPFYLWAMPVAPDAAMDDGNLEIAVYSRMGRLELLRALIGLWRTGEYPSRPVMYRGARIEVRCAEPLPVHADGKIAGALPMTIAVRPGALAVYAPKAAPAA